MSIASISEPAERRVVYCIALAAFFFQFESFMVIVALPDMVREMQTSAHAVSYVISGLLFGVTSSLVCASWIGQRLGFSRLFLLGACVATIATLACAIAPNLLLLIGFRITQGLGMGTIVASSYALLPLHVKPSRLGWAFGMLSTGAGVGMILGLPVGGLISSWLDWRWLFFASTPFLLGLTLFAYYSLPPHEAYIRNLGACPNFKEILKLPNISNGLMVLFVFQGTMGGLRFFVPFLIESQNNISPTMSGLIFLSYPLGFFLLSSWAGRQVDTHSPNQLMLYASLLSLIMCLLCTMLVNDWGVGYFSVFLLLLGSATGLFTAPNNVAIIRGLSRLEVQVASALIPITLNASLLFGTLIFGFLSINNDSRVTLTAGIAAFIVAISLIRLHPNQTST